MDTTFVLYTHCRSFNAKASQILASIVPKMEIVAKNIKAFTSGVNSNRLIDTYRQSG